MEDIPLYSLLGRMLRIWKGTGSPKPGTGDIALPWWFILCRAFCGVCDRMDKENSVKFLPVVCAHLQILYIRVFLLVFCASLLFGLACLKTGHVPLWGVTYLW